MLTFDKMKIVSHINNISNINEEEFVSHFKGAEILYHKYHKEKPYNLLIMADYCHNELVIEFTGKILKDNYKSLINRDNIRECFNEINKLDICSLDIDDIISNGNVVKCDVTKDIHTTEYNNIICLIKQNLSSYKKWVCKEYRGGLSLENCVATTRYKKRLIVYDKAKELSKATNVEFLNSVSNADDIISYFEHKIRFELNMNTMKQIRDLLCISDNNVMNVFSSSANPILSVFDEAVKKISLPQFKLSLRDYERSLLLKECHYNMVAVEMKLRALIPSNTSIKRTMEPYYDLYQQLHGVSYRNLDVRGLLV